MKLDDAMATLVALEATVEITAPPMVLTDRVWRYFPPADAGLQLPCLMHSVMLNGVSGHGGYREHNYTINPQLLVGVSPGQTHKYSEDAAQWAHAFLNLYDANVMLGESELMVHNLRGGPEGLIALLEWNGIRYVGVDLLFDLKINDTTIHGAGA